MSSRKRNSNHLFLSEPQNKFTKYNIRSPFQPSDFHKPVQIAYASPNPNLKMELKMELEMNKILEKLQNMEKQIKTLEKQTLIQAEYIDKLEHRNQSRIDDMSQLVTRIEEMEIEKKNYSMLENKNQLSSIDKLPKIKNDISYIS